MPSHNYRHGRPRRAATHSSAAPSAARASFIPAATWATRGGVGHTPTTTTAATAATTTATSSATPKRAATAAHGHLDRNCPGGILHDFLRFLLGPVGEFLFGPEIGAEQE